MVAQTLPPLVRERYVKGPHNRKAGRARWKKHLRHRRSRRGWAWLLRTWVEEQ